MALPGSITCDNGYEARVNGTAVGSGNRWEIVQEHDVRKALRPGRNEIEVRARNDGGDAGLIAELVAGAVRVATDSTWQASKTETGARVAAAAAGRFEGSFWFTHPQGPPRLVQTAAEEAPKFALSPLAMTWWTNAAVLPFDLRLGPAPAVGWYRFQSPPGLRALVFEARGTARAWVNGRELPVAQGRVTVAEPSDGPVPVLLRIEPEHGFYAGAALPEPVRLECAPGRIDHQCHD